MERSEIGLLLSTFLVGIFVGGYVYVNGMWAVENDVLPTQVAAEWRLTGEEEGRCELMSDCQFVYVDANGSFRIAVGAEGDLGEEELPPRAREDLRALVAGTDFRAYQTGFNCDELGSGATWYRYRVERPDRTVSYLTCDEFVAKTPVNEFLAQLWDEAENYGAGVSESGAYRILHQSESTWLSNFRLIRFEGAGN